MGFGKAGSFEGFCSGGGIAQLAQAIIRNRKNEGMDAGVLASLEAHELDARSVALAAQDGDETALEIIRVSAIHLGKGMSVLIDILNPECIVIGSIYSRNEKLFKPHMEAVIRQEAIPAAAAICEIKAAGLGESIGDYAALCVAMYEKN